MGGRQRRAQQKHGSGSAPVGRQDGQKLCTSRSLHDRAPLGGRERNCHGQTTCIRYALVAELQTRHKQYRGALLPVVKEQKELPGCGTTGLYLLAQQQIYTQRGCDGMVKRQSDFCKR